MIAIVRFFFVYGLSQLIIIVDKLLTFIGLCSVLCIGNDRRRRAIIFYDGKLLKYPHVNNNTKYTHTVHVAGYSRLRADGCVVLRLTQFQSLRFHSTGYAVI
jgi:hypothetical protein